MKYVQTFVVEGSGSFPFDMLRYDTCFPNTAMDAYKLNDDDSKLSRRIEICRYVDTKTNLPTTARWASFLWSVSEVNTRKLK